MFVLLTYLLLNICLVLSFDKKNYLNNLKKLTKLN